MPEAKNCPRCGTHNTMHSQCEKRQAKVCFSRFITHAEDQKCSSCGAMFAVKLLPQ
jgi:hypothetical protein